MTPFYVIFSLFSLAFASRTDEPLVFGFVQGDPQTLRIFFHPQISVAKVTELANREVRYVENSAGKNEEKVGKWRILVRETDNDDGSKRYIFLKNMLCDEVDWQVSWTDQQGMSHGPTIQRMLPSPRKWKPDAKIQMKSLIYSQSRKKIILKTAWNVNDSKLQAQKLSEIKLVVELKECKFFFKRPVEEPEVLEDGKIALPVEYAQNGCSVWVRLNALVANKEYECRELMQTTDDFSLSVALTCSHIGGLDCPDMSGSFGQPCEMDCNPVLSLDAEYEPDQFGYPQPLVQISWVPNKVERETFGTKLRHVQVDRTYEYFPIKEFNVTVEKFAAGLNNFELEPYTKDHGASFGIQICVLLEESCQKLDVDWSRVGQKAVFFNQVFGHSSPPPKILPTTTKFYPPLPEVEVEAKPEPGPEVKRSKTTEKPQSDCERCVLSFLLAVLCICVLTV